MTEAIIATPDTAIVSRIKYLYHRVAVTESGLQVIDAVANSNHQLPKEELALEVLKATQFEADALLARANEAASQGDALTQKVEMDDAQIWMNHLEDFTEKADSTGKISSTSISGFASYPSMNDIGYRLALLVGGRLQAKSGNTQTYLKTESLAKLVTPGSSAIRFGKISDTYNTEYLFAGLINRVGDEVWSSLHNKGENDLGKTHQELLPILREALGDGPYTIPKSEEESKQLHDRISIPIWSWLNKKLQGNNILSCYLPVENNVGQSVLIVLPDTL